MTRALIIISSIILLSASLVSGAKIKNVEIADTIEKQGEKLILNGLGIRKKFGFSVYVGSLYLKSKTSDSKSITNADEPMCITMSWMRNVSAKKANAVLADGFKYSAKDNYANIKTEIETFLSLTPKVQKKDIWTLLYIPGTGTQILHNDKLVKTIKGLDFKKALFGIWILEDDMFTGDKNLRDKMLGK